MDKSTVYFTDFRCSLGCGQMEKLKKLCVAAGIKDIDMEGKFVAIKTKNMKAVLDALNVKKALVVLNENDENVVLSARNLADVKTALTNTLSVFDILKYNTVVVTKAAVETIEEVYA